MATSSAEAAPARPDQRAIKKASHTRAPRHQLVAMAIMVALLVAAPFFVYPVFLMGVLCFALFASAFNLLLGYAGLLSFGHAMFFGWAAYLTAHASKAWGLPPELAVLLGTALATGMGAVAGWVAIRRQGIYFAMITLALAQLAYFVALQAPLTHGEDGIQDVPRGVLFGVLDLASTTTLYYVVLAVFLLGLLILYRVVHSPFGQALKAIRDNEPRAVSLGYAADRYKLLAFTLSAGLTGLAGSMKSLVFQLASLTDVEWHTSGAVVLMSLLGGVGTLLGPTLGAFLVVGIESYLSGIGSWVTIIEGVIFVVCVLAFRGGIVGLLRAWCRRLGISL